MGLSDRYTFYWTLFTGLPFGIVSFIMGISLFFTTTREADDLDIHKGKIIDYGVKEVYHESIDARGEDFFLKLRHGYEFYSELGSQKEELIEYFSGKQLVGHSTTVWIERDGTFIKQLAVDDQVVMEFQPPWWNAWIFTIMGILVTTGAILYIKNNAADIQAQKGPLRMLFSWVKKKGSKMIR
ncbi:MAG: hypothetical protein ACQER7_15155 [Bacteroidota bacterium]